MARKGGPMGPMALEIRDGEQGLPKNEGNIRKQ
jgi:hypothetical protein